MKKESDSGGGGSGVDRRNRKEGCAAYFGLELGNIIYE